MPVSDPASSQPGNPDPWIETLGFVLRKGIDLREQGDVQGARSCFERCLDSARSIGCRPVEASAQACIGALELQFGSPQQARQHFEEALEIRVQISDRIGQARSLNDLALLDFRNGDADRALSRLRESLARTHEEPPGRTRADTLEHLGKLHRERGDPKQGLRHLKDALEIRRELKDQIGVGQDLDAIGGTYLRMGHLTEASGYLTQAHDLRRALGDRRALAVTTHHLGIVHRLKGEMKEAEELLSEALASFRATGDKVSIAACSTNLGLLYLDLGRAKQAWECHHDSLATSEELGNIPGQANSLNNLAQVELEMGRPREALALAERSLELRNAGGLQGSTALPLYNKAVALLDLGRAPEALEVATRAADAARQAGAEDSLVIARILCAEIQQNLGNLDQADRDLAELLPVAESIGDPRVTAATLRCIATVRAARGQLDEGRDLLTRAERAMRGKGESGELGRIYREQGRLAAAAGATQSAIERFQHAARIFAALGNHLEEARTLAMLARAEHGRAPERAAKIWQAALHAAAHAEPSDPPPDLGPPPGVSPTPAVPSISPISSLERMLELSESIARTGSLLQMGAWLVRLRDVLSARAVGLITAPVNTTEADAVTRQLADGRLLWLPHGQEMMAFEAHQSGGPTAGVVRGSANFLARAIPGTDGACWLMAEGPERPEEAELILGVLAIQIAQSRMNGIQPVGTEHQATTLETWEGLVGSSPPMQAVRRIVQKIAPSDASVLILGESGTGKELLARAIHTVSARSRGAFVPINCPSIPRELIEAELFGHEKGAYTGATIARPGKVELADGGTLFLDEIGDMDLSTQSKLLRFLQEREFQRVGGRQSIHVNVRVLAATSRDLEQTMEAGLFRADLYFRLNVVQVRLPALRERREDVPLLVRSFLEEIGPAAGRTLSVTPRALEVLQAYSWPGNVRELRNTITSMAAMADSDILDTTHIPASVARPGKARAERAEAGHAAAGGQGPLQPGETLEDRLLEVEAKLIRHALEVEGWNQAAAARKLGVTETKMRNRVRRFGLLPDSQRHGNNHGGRE